MLKNKNILITILLFTAILIQLNTTCFATFIPVTDENLTDTFEKFESSEANKDNYNISVSNNVINITIDNENYVLNYDLTDKPTFSFELPIEKGMSYEEFKKQTDNLILPMLGYIAVANIQGVEFEDASIYFLLSYLESSFNGSLDSNNSYIIIDDLNTEDGTIIESNNQNTIYTSEFGDRVIEYVNAIYPETQNISDAKGANSYVFTVEKQDMTETSCKLVATLTVNTDADFSKLKEIVDSFIYSDITKENADYTITLKVGQKCKIKTTEKITGHGLYNGSCVEFTNDYSEITAIEVGEAKGYLYIGEEKKSIYITVEENTGNETLETITLTIGKIPETITPNEPVQEETVTQEQNNNKDKDNTVATTELPKAGLNNIMFFIIAGLVIFIIVIGINFKKYRDIR